jgi:hypothetical protein
MVEAATAVSGRGADDIAVVALVAGNWAPNLAEALELVPEVRLALVHTGSSYNCMYRAPVLAAVVSVVADHPILFDLPGEWSTGAGEAVVHCNIDYSYCS